MVVTDETCQELLVAHRHLQSLSWLDNWMMGCREMVVVHPDVNFLDDITGQLGEVPSFSKLYAILSYLCSVVTELMLLTFLAPLLSFLSSVFTEMHSFFTLSNILACVQMTGGSSLL